MDKARQAYNAAFKKYKQAEGALGDNPYNLLHAPDRKGRISKLAIAFEELKQAITAYDTAHGQEK